MKLIPKETPMKCRRCELKEILSHKKIRRRERSFLTAPAPRTGRGAFGRIGALCFSLCFLLTLSGCNAFDLSFDRLLSPPKLTQAQTEIYNALILSVGAQAELIYPKTGDYRSPFVIYNMDDEPTDEAVVFYREKSPNTDTPSGLRMNLLDQKQGQWVSCSDKALSGADVERISFYDFGDGIDMMVSSSSLGQTENSLTVLTYSKGSFEELYKASYSFMDIFDNNEDGFDELFLINYDAGLGQHLSSLVGQINKEGEASRFGLLSSAPLSAEIVSVQRLTRQKTGEARFLFYLDYSKGESLYGTQLMSCHEGNLIPVDLGELVSRRVNSNIPMLYSTDIDGDGRVEIPTNYPMLGYEGLTLPEQMLQVDWLVVDENDIYLTSSKYSTYISTGYEYIFYIPVRWQGFISVQKTENNTVNFVHYDNNTFKDVMLSVRVSDKPPAEEGWEHFGDENSTVYIKVPSEDIPMAFTRDELNSSLYIVPKRSESK